MIKKNLHNQMIKKAILLSGLLFWAGCLLLKSQPINRQALVERHNVVNKVFDSLSSLSVGNGAFCFTVDGTGLQSFPESYDKGIPLGTESEWGWHSFPNTGNYRFEESLKTYNFNGRDVTYGVQSSEQGRNKEAADYFRQNVHRLQLGNLGFDIIKTNGTLATKEDIHFINQVLNLWTGEIKSTFSIEGKLVEVSTFAHQNKDIISARVTSSLLKEGRLLIKLRFPYPTGAFVDCGDNWEAPEKHTSFIQKQSAQFVSITHTLDTTSYKVELQMDKPANLIKKADHYFQLVPKQNDGTFSFSCGFSEHGITILPTYSETRLNNEKNWKHFWTTGGAIDFSGSTDKRAMELERRIVLSQYLTKIQCSGHYPPQETGLTYNSWYGKPHLEMHWWHAAHFALWNRIDLLENSLSWYADIAGKAKAIAQRQGYKGLRWPKMTDPAGNESPSSVGAFLIWQQPHFIYFAELCYRDHHDIKTLQKYKDLVFATAGFMASYARYDSTTHRYILGKGLIPAQECFKADETFNPIFELSYWRWGLNTAQQWRVRSGLARNKEWDNILNSLSDLPQQNGIYLPAENATDAYTNLKYRTDHPIVLGTYGMLPYPAGLDTAVMNRTFDWVWNNWNWKATWGWDFPLTAMAATRLGMPEKAIEALLMPIKTNTYLNNGHNYQNERLRLYLPGNGGLLSAIAMMCAGYDGCKVVNPGIPKNKQWKVKWEGLSKMP
jgi:hypothetical protein